MHLIPGPLLFPQPLVCGQQNVLAALTYCLLRQEGVLSVRPFFILDAEDLCGFLPTHQLGWLSPIPSLLQFKAVSHLLVVKYSLTGCLPSRLTPLWLSLLPWMHLCINSAGFTSHRHLNCSFKPLPLLRTLKVLLHLLPVPPPQPILLSLLLGFELFNPPCLDLLPSAPPLLSTLSHL